jgi:hypothetical protein
LLLVFAVISVFTFWPTSILIYISNSTTIFIDNFATYGKSLDNIPLNLPEVEIISPKNGESVYLSSELTINGTSSDTVNTNCTILTSINNIQPFQNALAIGSQGKQDFSEWNSTFLNASNLLRPGNNTITSVIACMDTNSGTPSSSYHLINLTRLPSDDNQSILSSVSRVIHDGPGNKIAEQHQSSVQPLLPSSGQSTTGNPITTFQNNLHTRAMHHNNGQGQGQSTLSPSSGQSTTGNP